MTDQWTATTTAPATLVTGIGELATCVPEGEDLLGLQHDRALVVEYGRFAWVGPAAAAPAADERLDLGGRAVLPGFVDSHSHLVFAGDRAAEFAARMAGERLRRRWDRRHRRGHPRRLGRRAARAAGRAAGRDARSGHDDRRGQERLRPQVLGRGSGSLRLAREVTEETTYLGAHVVAGRADGDRAAYLDLVTGPMLEACAPHARWVDVFCEPASPAAFTEDEARAVLLAGRAAGLGLRVHGNQLDHGPGVRLAVELGAASVDHCTYLDDADVDALAGGDTVAHAAAGGGVLDALALPGRPAPARRRSHPGAGHRLQPGHLEHDVDAVRRGPGRPRDADDPRRGRVCRDGRRGAARCGARTSAASRWGRAPTSCVLDAPSHLHLAYRPGVPIARSIRLGQD